MKYKVWFDNAKEILRADIYQRFDENDVNGFVDELMKYESEKQKYFLVFMDDPAQELIDGKTRKLIATRAKEVHWGKIAIMGARPVLRMFAKIAVTAIGKSKDTGFFKDEQEAETWLAEQKNTVN